MAFSAKQHDAFNVKFAYPHTSINLIVKFPALYPPPLMTILQIPVRSTLSVVPFIQSVLVVHLYLLQLAGGFMQLTKQI